MNLLGFALLVLVAVACVAGLASAVTAIVTRRPWAERGTVVAVHAVAVLAVLASIVLVVLLVTRDFSNQYVVDYTSRSLSWAYTVSAFWAGNAGSLLLWLLLMSLFSMGAVRQIRREAKASTTYVAAILLAISTFFVLLIIFGHLSDPFVKVAGTAPLDGLGMNPVLQHPGMVIHPVALYLGYVGCAIPFALVLGGLLARSPSSAWLPAVRRWALIGWFFLSLGNLIGAWWAYVTLGWGGYWAWDPVENASLMPWLIATAVVHSVAMMRRRRMFSAWTSALVVIAFLLTIFGTFLTRSGIATSVHAFSDNTYIPWFTIFLAIAIVFSVGVLISRRSELRAGRTIDGALSRESAFLYTNIVLVAITFVVLWGVAFPTVVGAIRGTKIDLGTHFYTLVTVPLTLILMLLIGVCPLLPWRGKDDARLFKDVIITVAPALVTFLVILALGVRKPYTLLSFTLAMFATVSVLLQYWRGWMGRRKATGRGWVSSFGTMVWTNRTRYGGFLVHLGVIVVLVGITGSYAFKQVVSDTNVAKGESVTIGRFVLTFDGLTTSSTADKEITRASFTLLHNGTVVGHVDPAREYHPATDETLSKVGLYSTLAGDVYVSLLGSDQAGGTVNIQAQLNPLVGWLWIGGFVLGFGGLVVLWPARRARAKMALEAAAPGSVPAEPALEAAEAGAAEAGAGE